MNNLNVIMDIATINTIINNIPNTISRIFDSFVNESVDDPSLNGNFSKKKYFQNQDYTAGWLGNIFSSYIDYKTVAKEMAVNLNL